MYTPEAQMTTPVTTGENNVLKTAWQSPSNIALVKYWGKRDTQIPCNPSVSFTLSACHTVTEFSWEPVETSLQLELYFDGERNPKFEEKNMAFFHSVAQRVPFLQKGRIAIHTRNTFPHGAGIASSASGMSAIALCLVSIQYHLDGKEAFTEEFYEEASELARLGSGSACRSIYGGLVVWGETEALEGSSDLFGVPVPQETLHPLFRNYCDDILIVDEGEKKVSSRAGHGLMNTNPFAERRFEQAADHMPLLLEAMRTGDLETFINITELEALTLHGMMMTSQPSFILMKPNTLAIIEKIRDFRERTSVPVCFTLDAGPNVHMLYPEEHKEIIRNFIQDELFVHLSSKGVINDGAGPGPLPVNMLV